MDELQEYFNNILAHLDAMAKRTIFMMGVEYGKQKKSRTRVKFQRRFFHRGENRNYVNKFIRSIHQLKTARGWSLSGLCHARRRKKYFYGTPEEVRDKIQKYLKSAPAPNQTKIFLQFVEGRSLSFCSDFFWQPDCASAKRWR